MSKSEVTSPAMPEKKKGHDEWEVKEALETLMRAKEIENNPSLMKEVHKLALKKEGAIRSIQDLKDRAEALDEEDSEED